MFIHGSIPKFSHRPYKYFWLICLHSLPPLNFKAKCQWAASLLSRTFPYLQDETATLPLKHNILLYFLPSFLLPLISPFLSSASVLCQACWTPTGSILTTLKKLILHRGIVRNPEKNSVECKDVKVSNIFYRRAFLSGVCDYCFCSRHSVVPSSLQVLWLVYLI